LDSIPIELLELQNRFKTWRANRKYVREPIPDELRSAALEMLRRFPPSLIHRHLKVDPSRLKKKPQPSRPIRSSVPNRKAKSSTRAKLTTLPQPAFFKLPVDSSPAQTPAPCRLQFERGDGSRLTLILPGLDALIINSLVADFLRGGRL
jgi:hypothetical protein